MAKIYSNENFPLPVVEALRDLKHDVLTTAEAGKDNQAIADEAVLAFAIENGLILVTLNRKHFIRLHNDSSAHKGIIVCTYDSDFKALAERIHVAIEEAGDCAGKLIHVNRPQKQ